MAANDPVAMDAYLEDTLDVDNAVMRERIQDSGYETLNDLIRKDPKFATKVCQQVRKSTGGVAANKDVPVCIEEWLFSLIIG